MQYFSTYRGHKPVTNPCWHSGAVKQRPGAAKQCHARVAIKAMMTHTAVSGAAIVPVRALYCVGTVRCSLPLPCINVSRNNVRLTALYHCAAHCTGAGLLPRGLLYRCRCCTAWASCIVVCRCHTLMCALFTCVPFGSSSRMGRRNQESPKCERNLLALPVGCQKKKTLLHIANVSQTWSTYRPKNNSKHFRANPCA